MGPEDIQKSLEAFAGPEDREWYRGNGTPYLHYGFREHAASIELETGQKLLELIRQHKPKTLVEVGTNIGFSTCWQLLGIHYNGFGHLTTFDINEWETIPKVWTLVPGLDAAKITFIKSSVWEGSRFVPEPLDWAFIDASHDVEPTIKELETICPRMAVGGVVTFHDTQLCRHMGTVIESYFRNRPNWKYDDWMHGRGLGIAQRLS